MKLNNATAAQKKWPTQIIYATPLSRPLGHPTEIVFNAAVVLLANVIAHQSETFSQAEDAGRSGRFIIAMTAASSTISRSRRRSRLRSGLQLMSG